MPETTPYTDLPYFKVYFTEKYGLKDLSGESMENLVQYLKNNKAKAKNYFFDSIGVDIDDEEKVAYGIRSFQDYDFIEKDMNIQDAFTDDVSFNKMLCLMSKAKTQKDLEDCIFG